jgi:hypothetical protein
VPLRGQKQAFQNKSGKLFAVSKNPAYLCTMTKTKTAVKAVQGTPNTQSQNDLFAMFQAFMAMQAQQTAPVITTPVTMPVVIGDSSVKSKAKVKPAPVEKPAKVEKTVPTNGVFIHELANSFFVYGDQAPAKLAAFFTRKPHLDRGFKERKIEGLGTVKAYWFGGRQIAKIRKEIAK